jgi:hypothetical protein
LISIKETTRTRDFSALAEFASRVAASESINIQSRFQLARGKDFIGADIADDAGNSTRSE